MHVLLAAALFLIPQSYQATLEPGSHFAQAADGARSEVTTLGEAEPIERITIGTQTWTKLRGIWYRQSGQKRNTDFPWYPQRIPGGVRTDLGPDSIGTVPVHRIAFTQEDETVTLWIGDRDSYIHRLSSQYKGGTPSVVEYSFDTPPPIVAPEHSVEPACNPTGVKVTYSAPLPQLPPGLVTKHAVVVVKASVGDDGILIGASVLSTPDPVLDQYALAAAHASRFQAATVFCQRIIDAGAMIYDFHP
jgi:hypothetical protein